MSKRYPGGIIRKTPQTPSQTSAQGVWGMTDVTQAQLSNTWPIAGLNQPVSRSLRFRSSANAYLNRTLGSPTSSTTWTYSGWVKRGSLSSYGMLLTGGTSASNYGEIYFDQSTASLIYFDYVSSSTNISCSTNAVFRDPAAWYHIVVAVDTTQATASNRVKLYVNGLLQTLGTATYPSQNTNTALNTSGYSAGISALYYGSWGFYADQYLAEVNFIDGQALTPSSFGATNAQTGVWQPAPYTGSYGTNGFYLPFSDVSSLGRDFSGNSNNWTTNNISTTSGVTYDSMVDTPTQWIAYNTTGDVGGVVRGNYCVLNGANNGYGTTTLSQGNLYAVASAPGATEGMAVGTIGMTTGKWYWEVNVVSVNTTYSYGCSIGIGNLSTTTGVAMPNTSYAYNAKTGNKLSSTGSFADVAYGASYTANDVIGVAFDASAGTLTFYKNNVSQGTAFTGISSDTWFARFGSNDGCTLAFNFGQRPFAYTPPTGFVSLNTFNLPTPTIGATASTLAGKYFNPVLYTGDNTASKSITGVGFQPDFVWIKARSIAYSNILYDAVRGTGNTKNLSSDTTSAEPAFSTNANLTSFDTDGFTVGSTSSTNILNGNTTTYVAWNWKANGSGSSNTSGSITSTVSANTSAGFSIVTFTTTTASTQTWGHGLGVAPKMVIVKWRDSADNWYVYHESLGNNAQIKLNTTDAQTTPTTLWNTTSPSSTVVTFGSGFASAHNFVAYCFAEVAGYSKFGSYTGNGSADGPFIYTGFRPRFVLIKLSSAAGANWEIYDSARNTYNATDLLLLPSSSSAEGTFGSYPIDLTSNGFKVRGTGSGLNDNGQTLIYAAFAENPFKYSLAR